MKERVFEQRTCPKCGRTFKNENQSHYCGKAPETIDEYIDAQDESVKPYLNEIRQILCLCFRPQTESKKCRNTKQGRTAPEIFADCQTDDRARYI